MREICDHEKEQKKKEDYISRYKVAYFSRECGMCTVNGIHISVPV